MNIDYSTIVSFILTVLIILLIIILIYYFLTCSIKEGLQDFGEEDMSLNAPLPYKTIVDQIKYPKSTENTIYPIYDSIYNLSLFNKVVNQDQYSDNEIMNDLKYFNNTSNLLLEQYYNDNRPSMVTKYVQDVSDNSTDKYYSLKQTFGDICNEDDIDFTNINEDKYYDDIGFNVYNIDISNEINNRYLYNDHPEIDISYAYLYLYEDDNLMNYPPKSGRYLFYKNIKVEDEDDSRGPKYYNTMTSNLDFNDTSGNIYNVDDSVFASNNSTDNHFDISYGDVYDRLINCYPGTDCSFGDNVEDKGKYSAAFFESNYEDISKTLAKDFKYFNGSANVLLGNTLYNK